MKDISRYFYENSQDIFTTENTGNTICEIKLNSKILLILPRTKDLNNIKNYKNLTAIEINNFKIGERENDIFENHHNILKNVSYLKIWNIRQNDLELVKHFPNLTHLMVSYIRTGNFSFEGLKYADKINTLNLISANKICDFNFLPDSAKQKLKNISITYCSRLVNFSGIEGYKNLETLEVCASTIESRKRISLESMDGLERLNKLNHLKLEYYNFSLDNLSDKIKKIVTLKECLIDGKPYKK